METIIDYMIYDKTLTKIKTNFHNTTAIKNLENLFFSDTVNKSVKKFIVNLVKSNCEIMYVTYKNPTVVEIISKTPTTEEKYNSHILDTKTGLLISAKKVDGITAIR